MPVGEFGEFGEVGEGVELESLPLHPVTLSVAHRREHRNRPNQLRIFDLSESAFIYDHPGPGILALRENRQVTINYAGEDM
jgi:hypothetical protein